MKRVISCVLWAARSYRRGRNGVGPRRALMTILHADHVPLLGAIRGAGLPTAGSVYVVSWR